MARSIVSLGMLTPRALSTAARNRGLPLMSPPPTRADTVISLMTLVQTLDFLASDASFLCLILDHRLWPDIPSFLPHLAVSDHGGPAPGVGGSGVRFHASGRSQAVCTRRWTALPDQVEDETSTQPP